MIALIAEKPSVAKDIARIICATGRTADLRLLQRTTQDYFDESQSKQTERPVKKDK